MYTIQTLNTTIRHFSVIKPWKVTGGGLLRLSNKQIILYWLPPKTQKKVKIIVLKFFIGFLPKYTN